MKKIATSLMISCLILIAFDVHGSEISKVSISPGQIDPTTGERVRISFYLGTDAKIKIRLYDADNYVVKEMNNQCSAGMNFIEWDGKDKYDNIVPDEAYYFTIEAKGIDGGAFIYDPTDFSGGEDMFVSVPINFAIKYNIDYLLEKNARVRIRAGIYRSAFLKSIVDWEPRLAGENSEKWNGKDESGLVNVPNLDKYLLSISAYTLPDNSVITKGNLQTYLEYQKKTARLGGFNSLIERLNSPDGNEATARAKKIRSAALARPNISVNDHYMLAKSFNFAPNFIADLASGVVSGEIAVRITLDEDSKNMLTNQRFEVLFLVDDIVISEEEEGYSPFTKFIDSKKFRNGEHSLIINLIGLNDYVGERSILMKVEN